MIVHNSTHSKGSTINANPKYRTKLESNKKLTLHIVNYNVGQKDNFTKSHIHYIELQIWKESKTNASFQRSM